MTTYNEGDCVPYHADFEGDPDETCFCCNKPLGKSGWGVVIVGGGVIGTEDADETDLGFMGLYRVGSTCRKKFPTAVAMGVTV